MGLLPSALRCLNFNEPHHARLFNLAGLILGIILITKNNGAQNYPLRLPKGIRTHNFRAYVPS